MYQQNRRINGDSFSTLGWLGNSLVGLRHIPSPFPHRSPPKNRGGTRVLVQSPPPPPPQLNQTQTHKALPFYFCCLRTRPHLFPFPSLRSAAHFSQFPRMCLHAAAPSNECGPEQPSLSPPPPPPLLSLTASPEGGTGGREKKETLAFS